MASADGQSSSPINGEIYNYRELRDELASARPPFRTSSDTEVLINGYRQWGTRPAAEAARHVRVRDRRPRRRSNCCSRAIGSARSRCCISTIADGTTFASELTPLSRVARTREIDPSRARPLPDAELRARRTRRCFEGVRRLPPASWRLYSPDGRIEQGTYWTAAGRADVRDIEMTDGGAASSKRCSIARRS